MDRLARNKVWIGIGSIIATASVVLTKPNSLKAYPVIEPNLPSLNSSETTPTASSIEQAKPAETLKSVGIQDGTILINGKRTFITGVWGASPDLSPNIVDQLGINTIFNATPQMARALQGKAWVTMAPGSDIYPNQVMNELVDEPEGYNIFPDQVPLQPANGLINDQNFTQHIADGVDPGLGSPNLHVTSAEYPKYLQNLGVGAFSFDQYAMNYGQASTGEQAGGLIYDNLMRARKMANQYTVGRSDTPIGVWIEAERIDSNSVANPVTPENTIKEMYAALAGQATMLKIWNWSWVDGYPNPNAISPDVASAIKAVFLQINQNPEVFLATPIENFASTPNDPLKVSGRYITNQKGQRVNKVLLFNSGVQVMTTRRHLPDLSNQYVAIKNYAVVPNSSSSTPEYSSSITSGRAKANKGKTIITIPPGGLIVASYIVAN